MPKRRAPIPIGTASKLKGINIKPPRAADWGGQELVFKDTDGNELGFSIQLIDRK